MSSTLRRLSDAFVLIAVLALATVVLVPAVPADAGVPVADYSMCTGTTTVTCTFSTAGSHTFTVPAGVTSLTIVANGGGGGGSGATGGSGTRVTATRAVTANQVIAISVAGGGIGGGQGSGGGGGGATRIDTSVIVAGGGGGSGARTGGGAGGSLAGGGNGLAGSVGAVGTTAGGGGVLGSGGSGGAGGSGSSPCAGFSSGTCAGDSGTGTAGGAGGGDSTHLAGGFGGGGSGGYGGAYQPYPPQVLTGAGGGGGGGGYGGGGGGGAGSVADGTVSGGGGGVGGSTGPAGSVYGSAGNGGAAASSGGAGSVTITYTKATQTITFGALVGKTFGNVDFSVSATSTSGGTVNFSTTTTDVCSVSGSTVSIDGAGTCTILADQSGSAGYQAATQVSQGFTVSKADQTITFGALGGKTFGDADFAVSASASSTLGVAFTALTSGVCTVLGDTVTIVGAGLCTIDADQAGDDDWNAAPQVSQSFTVDKANQTITFDALGDKVFGDADFDLSASASSTLDVGFKTASTGVCTVTGSTVSIVGAGICEIRSFQDGDDDWNAADYVDRSFTVAKADQAIDYATPIGLVFGDDPRTILATADSGLPVVLSTGTPTVCTVSGDSVTIVGAGTCVVDADQDGDDDWNAAPRLSRNLTVAKADQTIGFTTPSAAVFGDDPRTVVATAGSDLSVAFTSGTPTVCTVSGDTVTIVAAGSCLLDADQAGDDDWNAALRVSRNLTVGKAGQTIAFGALGDRTFGDDSFQVSASATSGGAVTFASGTAGVCSVAAQTVTILAAGECTVEARQAGGANHLAAPVVSRGFTVVAAAQKITFGPVVDAVFGGPSFFVAATASSGLSVTFTSTTPTVCTVDGSEVTIVGAGICTIVAAQVGDDGFASAPSESLTLQILRADTSITFDAVPGSEVGADSFELNATTSSGLPVSFSSQTPEVCTVDGATVTVLSAGTCTITAVDEGDADHAAGSTEITFEVVAGVDGGTAGGPIDDDGNPAGAGTNPGIIALLVLLAGVGGTVFVLRLRR